jgi:hypothetical protein
VIKGQYILSSLIKSHVFLEIPRFHHSTESLKLEALDESHSVSMLIKCEVKYEFYEGLIENSILSILVIFLFLSRFDLME